MLLETYFWKINQDASSDHQDTTKVLFSPCKWPKHRGLLRQIFNLRGQFHSVAFEGEKVKANQIARDIVRVVRV